MQTIFDEMIKELIITTICSWIVISGIYLLIEVQLPLPLALACAYLFEFASLYWLIRVFATALIRYFCIFHSAEINDISDQVIVQATRLTCFIGALWCTICELIRLSFSTGHPIVQKLMGQQELEEKIPQMKFFLTFINLAFIIWAYIRIEVYKAMGWVKFNSSLFV